MQRDRKNKEKVNLYIYLVLCDEFIYFLTISCEAVVTALHLSYNVNGRVIFNIFKGMPVVTVSLKF